MPAIYEHIKFNRETNFTDRRPKKGFGGKQFSADPLKLSNSLRSDIQTLKEESEEIKGFDDRRLIKLNVEDNFDPTAFESITGIELVSQEDKYLLYYYF